MQRLLIFLAIVLGTISAPAPQRVSPSVNQPAEVETLLKQLRDADLDFARQTAARRLDGWMDFFADDASIIHDGKTVTGREALRRHYEPMFANSNFSLSWSPTRAEASQDGTLGYTFGNYEARNGSTLSRGMYVTVWRRIRGQWKVVFDTGSAMPVEP